jgi:hypothetical protein
VQQASEHAPPDAHDAVRTAAQGKSVRPRRPHIDL